MRPKYSIGLALLAVAGAAPGGTCPPAVTQVARQVATLRQVPPPFAPPCRVVSPATAEAELERKLRRDLPVPLDVFVEALYRLGFIDGDLEGLIPRLLAFYRSQVLGFYDPERKEMVIVQQPGDEDGFATLVWAHELAHAAQERRFRLPSRIVGLGHNSDAQRAAAAVAEGDALLSMFLLAMPDRAAPQTLALAETALRRQVAAQFGASDLPDYFIEDLLFPYTAGLAVVLTAYRNGGWAAVDRLLAEPPTSTAALLHPDRPPPRHLTNAELPPLPAGYESVLTDSLGEWGLSAWLGRRVEREEAERLAAAWRGDRLLLARSRRDPARWALAWELAFGDASACAALEHVMQRHAPSLLARVTPAHTPLLWQRSGPRLSLRAGWPQQPQASATETAGGRPPRP